MKLEAMKKDDFYRQMFKLTIPIIIQNLLSAAVNSADVIPPVKFKPVRDDENQALLQS